MKIVIDIPDKDIPERGQYMLDAYFDFHTGELCSCSYPYIVLPKGHGRLIGSPTMKEIENTIGGKNDFADCIRESVKAVFDNAQTIVPADKEMEE